MKESVLYGPVPSRRLGRSLGIDLVPYKVCSYDCIYCQLGSTGNTMVERKPYVSMERIIEQLSERLSKGLNADFITLAGSGEPTLNSEIARIAEKIKEMSSTPVALLTNGSLLWDRGLRNEIKGLDVVLPSLDAYDQKSFDKINRPDRSIPFETMLEGLKDFGREFRGEVWLEVFLLEGINAARADARRFRELIEEIGPQRIQINTAVRPPAESVVRQVSKEDLESLCKILGPAAEVVASFSRDDLPVKREGIREDILNLLARRPCTLEDISSGLRVHKNELIKYLETMLGEGLLEVTGEGGPKYYRIARRDG